MAASHAGAAPESGVMHRLKTETHDLHTAAEHQPFQQALVRGQITRDDYCNWLGQMLLLHDRLETHLRGACSREPRVAAVVKDFQFQRPYLEADLRAMGRDPASVEPLAETAEVLEDLGRSASRGPLFVLGMHYVLEGSNNGNRFIARAVRGPLGLQPGVGDRYLDPYGESQREKWQGFRADMSSQPFSDAEADELVDAAKAMFGYVGRISEGLERVRRPQANPAAVG